MTMLETAEVVADRYGVSREAQDEYSLQSQQRTAAGAGGRQFKDEIVPMTTKMVVTDKATGATSEREVTLSQDEGNRPQTQLEDLQNLQPVFKDGQRIKEGRFITAGNASQLSDGASAVVLMEAKEAEKRGLNPLGAYRGMAVAGCDPDEMGIGPVFAVPKLLKQHGLKIDDIDLWELNEAFAVQVLYCRDKLGIPNDKLNVNGGAISIGHPYGMSGARMTGHILHRGQAPRRQIRRRHHVRRRRHGRRRTVRDLLSGRQTTDIAPSSASRRPSSVTLPPSGRRPMKCRPASRHGHQTRPRADWRRCRRGRVRRCLARCRRGGTGCRRSTS